VNIFYLLIENNHRERAAKTERKSWTRFDSGAK